jgi:hypothetical protein
LFSLTELKILEMRATRMRLLPVTLPKLTKLERLDLGANSFIEFVSCKNKNFFFYSNHQFFLA